MIGLHTIYVNWLDIVNKVRDQYKFELDHTLMLGLQLPALYLTAVQIIIDKCAKNLDAIAIWRDSLSFIVLVLILTQGYVLN